MIQLRAGSPGDYLQGINHLGRVFTDQVGDDRPGYGAVFRISFTLLRVAPTSSCRSRGAALPDRE